MTYWKFREQLHHYKVFSLRDIIKLFPGFDTRRLVEWQQKGYIQKLINKWYLFTDVPVNEWLRFRIANCLHHPSYISLESSLSHYNLIPEGVYTTENITTKKTITYETVKGTFRYRSLKPNLFFGYSINNSHSIPVLVAEPEKALLDFFYLNSQINTTNDLDGLRLNISVLNELINWGKLKLYASCFESTVLNKRIKLLQKLQFHAGTI